MGRRAAELIGRDADLDNVLAVLADERTRVLTLTGPPGVGKSALAVAAALRGDRPGYVVDAADCVDAAGLAAAVLSALAGAERLDEGAVTDGPPPDPAAADLVEVARERLPGPALLVLDGLDGVRPGREWAGRLLAACPELRLLATSRTTTGWDGERQYPVQPLPVPRLGDVLDLGGLGEQPALELFVLRARAARPDLDLGEDALEGLADICRGLDGLPLALELAAGRVTVTPPRVLRGWLTEESGARVLTALRDPSPLRPARHRTLHAALEASWNRLGADEQRLLKVLSAFEPGSGLDAVLAVHRACAGPGPGQDDDTVLDLLSSLVDASLVSPAQQDSEVPGVVLLNTVRIFAQARLGDAPGDEQICARHAAHYLAVARALGARLNGPERVQTLGEIGAELQNLLSAVRWSCLHEPDSRTAAGILAAIWRFWCFAGALGQGRDQLDAARRSVAGMELAEPARSHFNEVSHALGVLARLQGDFSAAYEYLLPMVGEEEKVLDKVHWAYSLTHLAALTQHFGRMDVAPMLAESIGYLRETGDESGLAFALAVQGAGDAETGHDPAQAHAALTESLGIYQHRHDSWGMGLALRGLAGIARRTGDAAGARRLMEESLGLLRSAGSRWSLAEGLSLLADIVREQGDQALADQLAREHADLCLELGIDISTPRGMLGAEDAGLSARTPMSSVPANLADVVRVRPVRAAVLQGARPAALSSLTQREYEVLLQIVVAKSNPEIAEQLYIGIETARRHVSNILMKLGARNRVEAAMIAVRHGL
ncbi:MAG TPA: LuxR C-terminal-related transcriptional regulator [Mycobacteriales bacterium]|jgi:predicted ATPase/DNA-binding CsgD family transcriptional regulator|nr:LuxR C-terminal-related transcriptional regulator [Mycobacteriales bacterium]